MEGLKDIKDVVEVQEHSLLLLLSIIFVVLLLLSLGIYLFKNRRRRRKKASPKEIALAKLRNLDYGNAKEVVYDFEAYAEPFITQKNEADFKTIINEFGVYKYKKEVPSLESKLQTKIEQFIKELK